MRFPLSAMMGWQGLQLLWPGTESMGKGCLLLLEQGRELRARSLLLLMVFVFRA